MLARFSEKRTDAVAEMKPASIEKVSPVVVGVTGHRILADVERIRSGVALVLNHIEASFHGRSLIVVSSLAEGADRIVVEEALKRSGASLEVILPMPRGEYERDFPDKKSKNEFEELMKRAASVQELPPQEDRGASYGAAGLRVLDRSEVLLAVWDGKAEQGQGGTGEIVSLARSRHLPIARVHAGNRKPGTKEATSLGQAQGGVTLEGF